MDMKKILLVEDDDLLNKTLTYNLISCLLYTSDAADEL